jgi:hypothetical protein
METRFIKDTNEQYSIREDGAVINNNTGYILKQNTSKKSAFVDININSKYKRVRPNLLLAEYFNVKTCFSCTETKVFSDFLNNQNNCKRCLNIKDNKRKRENGQMKIATIKKRDLITKSYVANKLLKLKVSEMSEEMYKDCKKHLQFKRKVVKEQNVNYQSLI